MNNKNLPIILAIGLLFGFALGSRFGTTEGTSILKGNNRGQSYSKIKQVIDYIDAKYVEEVDHQELVDNAIEGMIKDLDPHTNFLPKTVFERSSEVMQGNFQGIGVEFYIMEDTVMVVAPIIGGPSYKLGILPGDRIVSVEEENIAGIGITNKDVVKKLKGKKGTVVNLGIYRRGEKEILKYAVERDDIPLHSVDASIMLNDSTGFIKVTRFSQTTNREFHEALYNLVNQDMKNLIIDLRGNSGGYLGKCISMVDQIVGGNELIVYTEGRSEPRREFRAEQRGLFETGKVVVLIDEGSASASEIFAGAIQDLDRGTIVGRRSFGKGLVQHEHPFPDSSAIRLTVSKYYTPLGRCIQKPFKKGGRRAYEEEAYDRYESGEVYNKDSIKIDDSLKFVTKAGKVLYAGGGIMPDVYVPIDISAAQNGLYAKIIRKGLVHKFAYYFVSKYRKDIENLGDVNEFKNNSNMETLVLKEFKAFARKKGVELTNPNWKNCRTDILIRLKAGVAQQVWRSNGYYQVISEIDDILKVALSEIK